MELFNVKVVLFLSSAALQSSEQSLSEVWHGILAVLSGRCWLGRGGTGETRSISLCLWVPGRLGSSCSPFFMFFRAHQILYGVGHSGHDRGHDLGSRMVCADGNDGCSC